MPKKRRVNKTKGKKKKNVRSRRRGGRKELRGGGVFENVRNWFTKTAYKMTPVPKKLLFMKVKDIRRVNGREHQYYLGHFGKQQEYLNLI